MFNRLKRTFIMWSNLKWKFIVDIYKFLLKLLTTFYSIISWKCSDLVEIITRKGTSENCQYKCTDSQFDICDCVFGIKYIPLALYAIKETFQVIKVFKTKSFLIVEYTVQFIPWTKTSNLSVSDVAKISKSFLKSMALFIIWVWIT
jgi:hypothetical protein